MQIHTNPKKHRIKTSWYKVSKTWLMVLVFFMLMAPLLATTNIEGSLTQKIVDAELKLKASPTFHDIAILLAGYNDLQSNDAVPDVEFKLVHQKHFGAQKIDEKALKAFLLDYYTYIMIENVIFENIADGRVEIRPEQRSIFQKKYQLAKEIYIYMTRFMLGHMSDHPSDSPHQIDDQVISVANFIVTYRDAVARAEEYLELVGQMLSYREFMEENEAQPELYAEGLSGLLETIEEMEKNLPLGLWPAYALYSLQDTPQDIEKKVILKNE